MMRVSCEFQFPISGEMTFDIVNTAVNWSGLRTGNRERALATEPETGDWKLETDLLV